MDVAFARGELTAIMGPSGSGKSTLMHCLAGLDTPTGGRVLDRRAPTSTGLTDDALTRLRRDRIGFVFQAFNLVPTLTALENITLPLDLAGRRPDQALWPTPSSTRSGCATGCATGRPSCPAASSSGWPAPGRWSAGPDVVFADEPTGDLDSRSGAEVLGFLRRSGRRARPDRRDGHPRPDRGRRTPTGWCSWPTAGSSTSWASRPPTGCSTG